MPSNIYDPGLLKETKRYAWRVDVVKISQQEGKGIEEILEEKYGNFSANSQTSKVLTIASETNSNEFMDLLLSYKSTRSSSLRSFDICSLIN